MQVSLIVAIDDKGGIGKNGSIPWVSKQDLARFYKITTKTPLKGQVNVLVMGRKTWDSIPQNKRPLQNRINVVLTRNEELISQKSHEVYFTRDFEKTFKEIKEIKERKFKEISDGNVIGEIFVIGGSDVYKNFANVANRLYLTRIKGDFHCDTFFPKDILSSFSSYKKNMNIENMFFACEDIANSLERFEMFEFPKNAHDECYLKLLKTILDTGKERPDRTGTGTISLFAPDPLRFDVRSSVPLLTTKKIGWKGIIKELLWFLRGDTDAKILQKDGVHIWDDNTSAKFLKNRGLPYKEGILGPGYGWSFRRYGAPYDEKYADSRNISSQDKQKLGGSDQLLYVENLLKTDPFSRRIYLNLWDANRIDEMALTPCHCALQFYAEQSSLDEKLDLSIHVYIRSNDMFLGNPYNIFSYTVFLYIMAERCNMNPKEVIISFGDAHIYKDHVGQVREQLSRKPYGPPRLFLSDKIQTKDYSEISIDDFSLIDYQSHPAIKAKMSA